ncbi:MAG TPA: hypothetical protein VK601_29265 [Kofleriaceae bacterium]|nr:hypothetical protein [Kofleriaceae bacterium]
MKRSFSVASGAVSARRAGMLLPLWFTALGCASGAEPLRGIDGEPGFGPYADVDQGAVARRIADPYLGVGNVNVAPDGSIRLWRWGLSDGTQDARTDEETAHILERYSPDGRLEERRALGHGFAVFHPDGELTIAREGGGGAVEYARWSSSFVEASRVVVPSSRAMVAMPEFYRIADDGTFTIEPGGMALEPPPSSLVGSLVAAGDGGFYGVQNFVDAQGHRGVRLLRLDADHAVVASTWMLPGAEMPIAWQGEPIEIDGKVITPTLRYSFEGVHLLVDRRQRVWALSDAPGSAAGALNRALGRPVDLRDTGDKGELFLMRFSPALELEAVVPLPAANEQRFAFIAEAADGTIGVAALSIEDRAIGPNKTSNYNVFFASVDPDGNVLGQRELDIDHDEWPRALAACGPGFCIGGETGTSWVDTGSQVEFAQGFVMAVGTNASPASLMTLHGPRRNVITTMSGAGDGSVTFAGTTDGPITHTDPAELSTSAVLGTLRL